MILSTVFSDYKHIATFGFVDRYEGMFVLLAYMIILFATINLVTEEKHIKLILGSIFITTTIVGIIGLFQYLGHDLWKSNFGKILLLFPKHKNLISGLKMPLPDNVIYSTLYHYNFVGSFMAMIFPCVFLCVYFLKINLQKYLWD